MDAVPLNALPDNNGRRREARLTRMAMQYGVVIVCVAFIAALVTLWPLYHQWQQQESKLLELSLRYLPQADKPAEDSAKNDLALALHNRAVFVAQEMEPAQQLEPVVQELRRRAKEMPPLSSLLWQADGSDTRLEIVMAPDADVPDQTIRQRLADQLQTVGFIHSTTGQGDISRLVFLKHKEGGSHDE